MLGFIINIAKGQLSEKIINKTNLSLQQAENLFPIAGVNITSIFKEELMNGNFTGIISLIESNYENNPLFKRISQILNMNFVNRLDISKEKSNLIVGMILPYVLENIRKMSINQKGRVDPANILSLISGGNGNQKYQNKIFIND